MDTIGKMPRSERIIAALIIDGYKSGDELSTGEIKQSVRKHYPEIPEGSILPSDFCDNHKNKDPFSGKHPIFHHITQGRYKFLGKPADELSIKSLAHLLISRNEIDKEIAALIQRPASTGHIGEYIASKIFDIELGTRANSAGIDGYFKSGGLCKRSVNIKFYTKNYSTLDINPTAMPDYYLILAGPRTKTATSKGTHSPLMISSVFLMEAKRLKELLQSVKIGIATSVKRKLWNEFEIYPRTNSGLLELSEKQREILDLFG